jgi:hypothetical protein
MTSKWATSVGVGYSPGEWVASARQGAWLLMEDSSSSPLARRCWERLGDEESTFEQVLDMLVSEGIEHMPSFALAMPSEDTLRVLVRGTASASWLAESGQQGRLACAEPFVWIEAVLPSEVSNVVLSGGTQTAVTDLPLGKAMTLASAIRLQLRTPASQAAVDIPARLTDESSKERTDGPERKPDPPPKGDPAGAAGQDKQTEVAVSTSDEGDVLTPEPDSPSDEVPGRSPEVAPLKPPTPVPPSYDHLFGATERTTLPPPRVTPSVGNPQPPRVGSAAEQSARGERADVSEAALPPVGAVGSAAGSAMIDLPPWAEAREAQPSPPQSEKPRPRSREPDPPPYVPGAASHVGAGVEAGQDSDIERTRDRSSFSYGRDTSRATVLVALCWRGHPTEPNVPACRVCGGPVPRQDPVEMVRPPLGYLRLSTGAVVNLDRGVVMGRDPVIPDGSKRDHPNTIRVASPERDVSRTHLEIVLEGWHVLVRDLGSKNGTVITQPGRQPLRLRADEPEILEPGAVVTMAEELSFRFEVGE